MGRFDGKVAVCFGSATGIGAATALRLGSEGAQVVVGDVNIDAAQALIDTIEAGGGQGLAVEFDIVEQESVEALIGKAVDRFGGIDALHINATDRKVNMQDLDILNTEVEVFDRIHSVSLRGHLLCTRFGLPELLKRGGGSIVYTSSGASVRPSPVNSSYSIAKAGLNALMRHVAVRWGSEGVRANAVLPGPVVTEFMMRTTDDAFRERVRGGLHSTRLGRPDDVAGMVALLLSDDGEWINGQAIGVDGGAWITG